VSIIVQHRFFWWDPCC